MLDVKLNALSMMSINRHLEQEIDNFDDEVFVLFENTFVALLLKNP